MPEKDDFGLVGTEEQRQDLSFPLKKAINAIAVVLLVSLILFGLPFWGIFGFEHLKTGISDFIFDVRITLPVFLGGLLIHECLHAAGFLLFARLGFKQLKAGFDPETFSFYAHPRIPVNARAYRVAIILPFFVLGLVPAILSLITGYVLFLFLGITMMAVAAGDILVFWSVRKVAPSKLLVDHPERAGCYVYDNPFEL
jgi:hypothetical protein